jgi:hypothetical protein
VEELPQEISSILLKLLKILEIAGSKAKLDPHAFPMPWRVFIVNTSSYARVLVRISLPDGDHLYPFPIFGWMKVCSFG